MVSTKTEILDLTLLRNFNLVKLEFTAELLYGIVLDCTGLPNKVASKLIYIHILF